MAEIPKGPGEEAAKFNIAEQQAKFKGLRGVTTEQRRDDMITGGDPKIDGWRTGTTRTDQSRVSRPRDAETPVTKRVASGGRGR